MSIARVDAQGNYSGADGSGNLNATITTAGSNPFLVVFAAIDSAGDISPTATHNSVSMGAGTEDNTTGQYQVVFTRKNPDIGTNLAVVVSTGLAGFGGGLIPVSYSGVDQTTPIGTIDAQGTAAGTSLASGTITCAAGNWIVGGLSLNTNLAGLAVGTAHGNSLVSSFNDGAEGIAYAEDLDGANDTMNWSWTASDRASALTFAINAAAAAAAATPTPAPTPRLILTDRVLVTGAGQVQAFAPRKVQAYPQPASFDFPAQNVPPLGQATPEVMRLKPFRAAPFLARAVPAPTQTVTFDPALMAAMSWPWPQIVISQPQAVASGMTPPDNVPN